jgi:HNH endonuclease
MDKLMRGQDKKPRLITGHKFRPMPMEERFWGKVEKHREDECWNWLGACFKSGYGAFGVRASVTPRAHKMAYELTVGKVPDGMVLLHTCDNTKCCNPKHLVCGTQKDNIHDCIAKGRKRVRGKNDATSG